MADGSFRVLGSGGAEDHLEYGSIGCKVSDIRMLFEYFACGYC